MREQAYSPICTSQRICTSAVKKRKRGGLTNPGILVYFQVAQGIGGLPGRHSRVEEASSQRNSKRRPEVDPIVRFITTTG